MKRRDFLRNMTTMVILPGITHRLTAQGIHPLSLLAAINNADSDNKALVLIQLKGGNDGLNTVIPLDQYNLYQTARPEVAIAQNKILPLNGFPATGLHPSMTALQERFNSGELKIIQSVGYPTPNFSHFRATDIWLSASDSDQVLTTGWAGRYLDAKYPGFPDGYPNTEMPDPLAIEIGSALSLGFNGPQMNLSISVADPTNFYNLINGVQDIVPNTPAGKELAYIRLTAMQSNQYAESISNAAENITQQSPAYPQEGTNALADQLKIVARLIAGGLKTKIYLVSLNGFDTHNDQVEETDTLIGRHTVLLEKLSVAIDAFMKDLEFLDVADKMVGMTFSEFGRRIKSNKSFGTDHGAAAPMFIFGKQVIPGILGNNPEIPVSPTVNSNVPMQYDFRSVYASVLEQWFGLDQELLQTVMLKNYQTLPIVKKANTDLDNQHADKNHLLIKNYPNPFTNETTIQYTTSGEHTIIEIFDVEGRKIATLTDQEEAPGTCELVFNAAHLPTGIYYARLQNKAIQQVRTMMKIPFN
jgi:uncharacterized protein (DUF1501 family)